MIDILIWILLIFCMIQLLMSAFMLGSYWYSILDEKRYGDEFLADKFAKQRKLIKKIEDNSTVIRAKMGFLLCLAMLCITYLRF